MIVFVILFFSISSSTWGIGDSNVCEYSGNYTNVESLLQHSQQRPINKKKVVEDVVPMSTDLMKWTKVPNKVIEDLITANPWNCSLLADDGSDWDRETFCEHTWLELGMHPNDVSKSDKKTPNAVRLVLGPIGPLPCCPTPPFCAAPVCSGGVWPHHSSPAATCTMYSREQNYAFFTDPEVFPVYRGWGGSFELDVLKHYDVLHRLLSNGGSSEPFDLAIDLGANTGRITDRWAVRNFAKSYILVDGDPTYQQYFNSRLGDSAFKKWWFQEQVPRYANDSRPLPEFEYLLGAMSDQPGGTMDFCTNSTEGLSGYWATETEKSCPAPIYSMDSLVSALSSDMQKRVQDAQSAYVKLDLEGMDQMVLKGMHNFLQEQRGVNQDGSPRHLVDFIFLEFCAFCREQVKDRYNHTAYDLKSLKELFEYEGFEAFFIGPRYLPFTKESWDERLNDFTSSLKDPIGSSPRASLLCPGPFCPETRAVNDLCMDMLAIRATHPQITEIKLALGACQESQEFNIANPEYLK